MPRRPPTSPKEERAMSKSNLRAFRADSIENHVHALPDGKMTQGQILKPQINEHLNGKHTHIYEHDGQVCESTPASIGPGHTHDTVIGITSGPMPVRKDASDEVYQARVQRRGARYYAIARNGEVLGSSFRKDCAEAMVTASEKTA